MPDEPELPKLDYPLLYVFRVVLHRLPGAKEHVRRLVEREVGPLPDDAVTERESRAGRFVAVHVSCLLQSEEQRRAVYLRLRAETKVLLTL